MLCVKCGTINPPGTKYCESCNAVIIAGASGEAPAAVVDVEEGQAYLSPEKNYDCPWFAELVFIIHLYLKDEADIEEVLDVYESILKYYEGFNSAEIPGFMGELDKWRHDELGREYSRQMTYLITKGFQLIGEGLQEMKAFLASKEDRESLSAGLTKIQEGVNNVGLAQEFLVLHRTIMEEEMARRQMQSRAEEFSAKIAAKQPAAQGEAE
ncbi:MAG: zinc ribbon domain-containing protein [Candidatus Eremiobacteraeota bacterium]|nr:zinc ribbon domain-containing protein [Candidatus Eremiobacteraeota bacterium]